VVHVIPPGGSEGAWLLTGLLFGFASTTGQILDTNLSIGALSSLSRLLLALHPRILAASNTTVGNGSIKEITEDPILFDQLIDEAFQLMGSSTGISDVRFRRFGQ
jgi:hypothetical protein